MAKDRLFFLISLGILGVLAAFLFSKTEEKQQPAAQGSAAAAEAQVKEQVLKVLVAQRKLNSGTRLTPSTYKWEEIKADAATPSMVIQIPGLEKKMEEAVVVREVPAGEKIKRLDILWPQEKSETPIRKHKALPLKTGMVGIMLGIKKNSPLLGYLNTGKAVDVVFTSGTIAGLGDVSLNLFKNIRILSIGSDWEAEGIEKKVDTVEVMLEMAPKEANVFKYASQSGTLSIEVAESGGEPIDENVREEELRDKLLASNSPLNFNSILATHLLHSLLPDVDVKLTATPSGFIVSGHIPDQSVANKVAKVMERMKGEKGFIDLIETEQRPIKPEEGKLSVLLLLDEKSPIGAFLKPGMFVNLIFSTRSASGFGNVTLTLLKNVKILSLGKPNGGTIIPNGIPFEVLLELTPREAEIFTYASLAGKLSLGMILEQQSGPEINNEDTEFAKLRDLLLTSKDDGTFNSILATFAIRKLFPGVDVTVVSTPKGFIAKGNVNEPQVAEKIREILVKLSHEGEKDFVDLMKVDPQQVLICVRVLEVSKEVTCKLGINWQALYENSGYSVALGAVFPRPLPTDPNYFIKADNVVAGNFTLNAIIDMLQQDNMGRVLAEPNLTTVSGRPATFFSGGEFPILIPQGGTLAGTVTVEYKKFGVILAFTPIVDLSGLITLHIVPEVSTIDEKNSVVIEGFKIPALVARRVDTTVKLWPGQSYAIAGLMQYDKLARYSSLYGLHRLPIIGPLFRSKEFIQQRTELMFVITPYLIYSDDPENYLHCAENCREEPHFCETPYCLH